MQNVLIAIVIIVLGLVACFYGYRAFRILLPILGLIYGYILGRSLVPPDQELLALAIGVVVGIVLALLAYAAWSVLIAIAGAVLGFALGSWLGIALDSPQWLIFVFALAGALLLGALYFFLRDVMVMLSTAFSGAAAVLYGLALLIPDVFNSLANQANVVTVIATIVLGVIGFIVQYSRFHSLRLYRREVVTR